MSATSARTTLRPVAAGPERQVRAIEIHGVPTMVETHGTPHEEAVVFIHGNPGSGADWHDIVSAMGPLAYCVAPDMPAYGRSARPERFAWTVAGYARHLAALIDRLGLTRVHLVLHDFGGPWGMAWASDHPQLVASITLINIGVLPGYRWHKYARVWRTPILGELFMACATRGVFGALMNAENPKPFPREFIDRLFDEIDPGTKRAALALYRATTDLSALTLDLGKRLANLQLPALVIWGGDDNMLPARYAAEQARFFGATEVHVLPGCGHWPHIDAPDDTRELITDFLRRQLTCGNASAGGSVTLGRSDRT